MSVSVGYLCRPIVQAKASQVSRILEVTRQRQTWGVVCCLQYFVGLRLATIRISTLQFVTL